MRIRINKPNGSTKYLFRSSKFEYLNESEPSFHSLLTTTNEFLSNFSSY